MKNSVASAKPHSPASAAPIFFHLTNYFFVP